MSGAIAEVIRGRHFYLLDSFEGLPDAGVEDTEKDRSLLARDRLVGTEDIAADTMRRSGAEFTLVRGWFNETVPTLDVGRIAVLRLDGDLYDSTFVCLDSLFPRVMPSGLVIIDDYGDWDGCTERRARLPVLREGDRDDPSHALRGDVPGASARSGRVPERRRDSAVSTASKRRGAASQSGTRCDGRTPSNRPPPNCRSARGRRTEPALPFRRRLFHRRPTRGWKPITRAVHQTNGQFRWRKHRQLWIRFATHPPVPFDLAAKREHPHPNLAPC